MMVMLMMTMGWSVFCVPKLQRMQDSGDRRENKTTWPPPLVDGGIVVTVTVLAVTPVLPPLTDAEDAPPPAPAPPVSLGRGSTLTAFSMMSSPIFRMLMLLWLPAAVDTFSSWPAVPTTPTVPALPALTGVIVAPPLAIVAPAATVAAFSALSVLALSPMMVAVDVEGAEDGGGPDVEDEDV
uniref:Uncharacterized protein n=1 Tax=Anopheles atroparvus TaxID=41427 RepID=A0A182IVI9_ANOAO